MRCCRARRAHDDERIDGAVADEHLDRTASTSGPRRDDRAAIDRDVWKTAVRRAISSEMGSENDDAVADRAQLYAQDAARGLVERVVVGEGDEGHDPYRWTDEDFPDKTAHSLLRRGVNLKPAAPAKTKTKPARASSPVPRRSSPAIDDVVEIVVRDVEVTAAVAANRCPPDTVTEATTRASGVVVADVDAGTLGVEGASAVQAPPRRDIRDVEDEEELMSSWQTAAETAAPSGTARDPIEIDADAEEDAGGGAFEDDVANADADDDGRERERGAYEEDDDEDGEEKEEEERVTMPPRARAPPQEPARTFKQHIRFTTPDRESDQEPDREPEPEHQEPEPTPGLLPRDRRRRGGSNERRAQSKVCRTCRTRKTPMWRHGPDGPKMLCNACGVRWKLGKAPRTKQAPRKRRAETRPDAKDADVVAKKPRVEPELEEAETPPLVVDEVPESERARADHRAAAADAADAAADDDEERLGGDQAETRVRRRRRLRRKRDVASIEALALDEHEVHDGGREEALWAKSPWEVVNVPPDDVSPARGGDADDGDGDGATRDRDDPARNALDDFERNEPEDDEDEEEEDEDEEMEEMERFDDAPENATSAGANAAEGARGQGDAGIAAAFARDARETANAMFSHFDAAFAPSVVDIQQRLEMIKAFQARRALELAELSGVCATIISFIPSHKVIRKLTRLAGEGRGARGGEPR